jgi:hypothetical protein
MLLFCVTARTAVSRMSSHSRIWVQQNRRDLSTLKSVRQQKQYVYCRPSHNSTIRTTTTTTTTANTPKQQSSILKRIWDEISKRPIEYATIPIVAGFVGISTNWLGVKMLFYPIDYVGSDLLKRPKYSPYGYFGWQGVVPTKTELMAQRLVNIITKQLLSLPEAFSRLDSSKTSQLLSPIILNIIR